jgi:hypothetical protein
MKTYRSIPPRIAPPPPHQPPPPRIYAPTHFSTAGLRNTGVASIRVESMQSNFLKPKEGILDISCEKL